MTIFRRKHQERIHYHCIARQNPIKLLDPDMPSTASIIPYLLQIEKSRHYSNFGPLVTELEHRLSALLKSPCQAVCNGTIALELGIQALNLPPKSTILVPAMTFIATGLAVLRAGHIPKIVDAGMLLTPEIAQQYEHDAVIPVCAFGIPNTGWENHPKPVLIDAAGAFGNQPVTCNTMYSLHATKSLGAGEGAIIASPDKSYLARVKELSNFGYLGTNAKMPEYTAAIALASLDNWLYTSNKRREIANVYKSNLSTPAPDIPSIFPVFVKSSACNDLTHASIPYRRYYAPLLSHHPSIPIQYWIDSPISDDLIDITLCIPFHTNLSPHDQQLIIDTLTPHIVQV